MFQITKPIRNISIQSALGEIVFDRHDIHYAEAAASPANCWCVFCATRTYKANVTGMPLAPAVIQNYFLRHGVFSVTISVGGEINRHDDGSIKFNKPRVLEVVMQDNDLAETVRFQKLMQAQLDSLQELTVQTNEEFLRQTGRTSTFLDYLPEGAKVVVEREMEKKMLIRRNSEVANRVEVVPLEKLVEYIQTHPTAFCWTEGGNPIYYKRYLAALGVVNSDE